MKRILITLSEKWPEYILEILVITFGILGAFALNNWNEDRNARIETVKFLEDLRAEFERNQEELTASIFYHQAQAKSATEILTWFEPGFPLEDSIVRRTILQTLQSWKYEPSRAIINSIVSSGKINLIEHDSLVYELNVWLNAMDKYDDLYNDQLGQFK